MTDDVDPIVVAECDDGAILDETEDGAIACVADGDGMTIEVDRDTEIGAQIDWIAGHRGRDPEALVAEAIEEFIDEQRGDGGQEPTVRCLDCGHEFGRGEAASASFDGDEALYQCPSCGAWVEGPPPGGA